MATAISALAHDHHFFQRGCMTCTSYSGSSPPELSDRVHPIIGLLELPESLRVVDPPPASRPCPFQTHSLSMPAASRFVPQTVGALCVGLPGLHFHPRYRWPNFAPIAQ